MDQDYGKNNEEHGWVRSKQEWKPHFHLHPSSTGSVNKVYKVLSKTMASSVCNCSKTRDLLPFYLKISKHAGNLDTQQLTNRALMWFHVPLSCRDEVTLQWDVMTYPKSQPGSITGSPGRLPVFTNFQSWG